MAVRLNTMQVASRMCEQEPPAPEYGRREGTQYTQINACKHSCPSRPVCCTALRPPLRPSHGCIASAQTWSTEVMGRSSGACSTMASEPAMHSRQPTTPNALSFSASM